MLASEGLNTSDPLDHLSQVLGPKHSERIRCRPKYISMSYWSMVSISSHAFGVVSQEHLDETFMKVAQFQECASQAEKHTSQL